MKNYILAALQSTFCYGALTVNDLKTERTFSSSKYLEIGQIYSSDKIN